MSDKDKKNKKEHKLDHKIEKEQKKKHAEQILEIELHSDDTDLNIGIDEENRHEVANLLTRLLSDEYTLAIKTQKYHWNLYGSHFGSLHKLFDDQYEQLQDYIDLIAERIRAIGFSAIGSLQEFIQNTQIKEHIGEVPNDLGMINSLLQDYEMIIRLMRFIIDRSAELNDQGTSNFAADLIVKHEKTAWMLRSFLNNNKSKLDFRS